MVRKAVRSYSQILEGFARTDEKDARIRAFYEPSAPPVVVRQSADSDAQPKRPASATRRHRYAHVLDWNDDISAIVNVDKHDAAARMGALAAGSNTFSADRKGNASRALAAALSCAMDTAARLTLSPAPSNTHTSRLAERLMRATQAPLPPPPPANATTPPCSAAPTPRPDPAWPPPASAPPRTAWEPPPPPAPTAPDPPNRSRSASPIPAPNRCALTSLELFPDPDPTGGLLDSSARLLYYGSTKPRLHSARHRPDSAPALQHPYQLQLKQQQQQAAEAYRHGSNTPSGNHAAEATGRGRSSGGVLNARPASASVHSSNTARWSGSGAVGRRPHSARPASTHVTNPSSSSDSIIRKAHQSPSPPRSSRNGSVAGAAPSAAAAAAAAARRRSATVYRAPAASATSSYGQSSLSSGRRPTSAGSANVTSPHLDPQLYVSSAACPPAPSTGAAAVPPTPAVGLVPPVGLGLKLRQMASTQPKNGPSNGIVVRDPIGAQYQQLTAAAATSPSRRSPSSSRPFSAPAGTQSHRAGTGNGVVSFAVMGVEVQGAERDQHPLQPLSGVSPKQGQGQQHGRTSPGRLNSGLLRSEESLRSAINADHALMASASMHSVASLVAAAATAAAAVASAGVNRVRRRHNALDSARQAMWSQIADAAGLMPQEVTDPMVEVLLTDADAAAAAVTAAARPALARYLSQQLAAAVGGGGEGGSDEESPGIVSYGGGVGMGVNDRGAREEEPASGLDELGLADLAVQRTHLPPMKEEEEELEDEGQEEEGEVEQGGMQQQQQQQQQKPPLGQAGTDVAEGVGVEPSTASLLSPMSLATIVGTSADAAAALSDAGATDTMIMTEALEGGGGAEGAATDVAFPASSGSSPPPSAAASTGGINFALRSNVRQGSVVRMPSLRRRAESAVSTGSTSSKRVQWGVSVMSPRHSSTPQQALPGTSGSAPEFTSLTAPQNSPPPPQQQQHQEQGQGHVPSPQHPQLHQPERVPLGDLQRSNSGNVDTLKASALTDVAPVTSTASPSSLAPDNRRTLNPHASAPISSGSGAGPHLNSATFLPRQLYTVPSSASSMNGRRRGWRSVGSERLRESGRGSVASGGGTGGGDGKEEGMEDLPTLEISTAAGVLARASPNSSLQAEGAGWGEDVCEAGGVMPSAADAEYYILTAAVESPEEDMEGWLFNVYLTDIHPSSPVARRTCIATCTTVDPHKRLLVPQPTPPSSQPTSATSPRPTAPPRGPLISPFHLLPWVSRPDQLYGHWLRVEAFAIAPVAAKVLDAVTFMGSLEGEEEGGEGGISAGSQPQPQPPRLARLQVVEVRTPLGGSSGSGGNSSGSGSNNSGSVGGKGAGGGGGVAGRGGEMGRLEAISVATGALGRPQSAPGSAARLQMGRLGSPKGGGSSGGPGLMAGAGGGQRPWSARGAGTPR